MLKKFSFGLVVLGCCSFVAAAYTQEKDTYSYPDLRFKIQKPDAWRFDEQSKAPFTLFIKPPLAHDVDKLYVFAVLIVTSVPGMNSADELPVQRETLWNGLLRGTYRKVKQEPATIAGERGQCLIFTSDQGEQSTRWEEYYLVRNSTLYLLQFRAPVSLFDKYKNDFESILKNFELLKVSEEKEPIRGLLEEELTLDPSSRRVVFICNVDSGSGDYLFLSAIPAASKLNNGIPIVIATNGRLSESAIHFLKRYSPGKVYVLGSEHQGIKGEYLQEPTRLWAESQTVVVSAKDLMTCVIAAPLAAKLNCPLLFDDEKLENELKRLVPRHIVLVGQVHRDLAAFAPKITSLKDAPDVATFFGNFDFLAVTNTYRDEVKADKSYLLAPLLAAYHGGITYALCEKIRFYFGVASENIQEEGKKYLQGKIPLGKSEVQVRVPLRQVTAGLPPHFDDPYLDIGDGKGFQCTKIGETKIIDGTEYAFSMRMIGALGKTKFEGHQLENRVYLMAPHAAGIQRELLRFYAKTLTPKYVAIVGTPASVPFAYERDPVYFNSTMQEQELATDNTYANIDSDAYLELAVGRVVNADVYRGSVNVAGMISYAEMSGDWQKRALLIYPTSVELEQTSGLPMVFSSFESLLKNTEQELKHAGFEVSGHYREGATLDTVYPHIQGQALIVFAQHSDARRWSFFAGNETKYLVPSWKESSTKLPPDIRVLPYFNAPSLIIGLGCDSGGLDTGLDPEETFLFGCFEKGAVGYVGNTRSGFPDTEEHAVKFMVNDIIYKGATVGEAFRNGKNYLLYVLRKSKPYRVEIFNDYTLAYAREFSQLVYYGDPALKMRVPIRPAALAIREQTKVENGSHITLLTIHPTSMIWQYEVVSMKQIGKGPVQNLKVVTAPGLSYSSTEWGDPEAWVKPPRVLPSVFVKYELPKNYSNLKVSLEEGPDWCYKGFSVETLENGKPYLLSNVAVIKYLLSTGKYEIAKKVVLKLTWR
jgi:hypothetical protein